jgi:hypothetical protein
MAFTITGELQRSTPMPPSLVGLLLVGPLGKPEKGSRFYLTRTREDVRRK